ncbi:bifunctional sulfate adenylyltransferase/adenylylsulfate kinase [Desulfotalea psychrophila]|uniref:adenylyl-sulfate kinase n=1 Tax=Desulfotalea psychrophila (strain LSv54 / DSM 12343) TaxID=177439 RepID=Q6ALD6_DESPS|nr:bifunctional sulfate adenylyltransferase/adenylylsulfate kinase [Desulfotalea psychrophila]CAG36839.1 probable sulfate adenylyltransferase [Desulfotalea psychrophila LSv54]
MPFQKNINCKYPETLLVDPEQIEGLKAEALDLISLTLSVEQICDLELLLNRGFYPLVAYMDQASYLSVLKNMRLTDGTLWPTPISLAVSKNRVAGLTIGQRLALNDQEGFLIAILTISDIWQADTRLEAKAVYGTTDSARHPGVRKLYDCSGDYYLAGSLEGISLPVHYDFQSLRLSPAETVQRFMTKGWQRVVGFQTDEYLHYGHHKMIMAAAQEIGAAVFIQAQINCPGEITHYTHVRCHQAFTKLFPINMAGLGLFALPAKKTGPREALLQAIIKKNFGCTHFMVAPDHADPFAVMTDEKALFYPRGEAQKLVAYYEKETEITMIPQRGVGYCKKDKKYIFQGAKGAENSSLIDSKGLMGRLKREEEIPPWFTCPKIVQEIRHDFLPRSGQGFTIFMTGLSGAGKSTIAKVLQVKFAEMRERPVTLLDGDIVRLNLSSELSFSQKDRNLNVTRIGFVAGEITKNGGIALCAPIAPYEESRQVNRRLISNYGGYIEVYVATPLQVCEQRDSKGLYAKARSGRIKNVTGITDPYIPPTNPEITIDTTNINPMDAAEKILLYLKGEGYL